MSHPDVHSPTHPPSTHPFILRLLIFPFSLLFIHYLLFTHPPSPPSNSSIHPPSTHPSFLLLIHSSSLLLHLPSYLLSLIHLSTHILIHQSPYSPMYLQPSNYLPIHPPYPLIYRTEPSNSPPGYPSFIYPPTLVSSIPATVSYPANDSFSHHVFPHPTIYLFRHVGLIGSLPTQSTPCYLLVGNISEGGTLGWCLAHLIPPLVWSFPSE